ncbi:MAG: hypothetical protein ACYCOR_09685 [Acidobacteriaceae bacterium]
MHEPDEIIVTTLNLSVAQTVCVSERTVLRVALTQVAKIQATLVNDQCDGHARLHAEAGQAVVLGETAV